MKTKIILPLLMVFNCFTMAAIGQDGFINKAEAKNLTVNRLKEGKWIEYDDEMGGFTTDTDAAIQYLSLIHISNKAEAKNVLKSGKKEGKWLQYFGKNTAIVKNPAEAESYSLTFYKNDVPVGMVRIYYISGKLKCESPFSETGEGEGVTKEYYESGKLKSEAPFTKGPLNGVVKSYYENGKLMSEGSFINGDEQGSIKRYDENGNPIK